MATPKRIWFEGALYHVTTRGNNKMKIFCSKSDSNYYIELVKESMEYYKDFNYEIACYCLMSNHVHLLLKANCKPLGEFMGRLNSRYTRYYNKKYNHVGHLFQGKYYCEIIKDDVQLLEASRYIHLNPVRASITDTPERYDKSSYSMLIGKAHCDLINPNIIWNYFCSENFKEDKFKRYRKFVETGM